ncbi:hypothetical protein LPJ70_002078 [Coemansia sp. RSA 2708]|nr:hypothetical protein LPJ70_002078 [Coemansia sp. RSA 2708]
MEFSDLYKQSNSALARFSPDGRHIAVAVEHRLIVRDTEDPKRIHRVFSTEYPAIQQIAWGPDGKSVLTASLAQSRVDVWRLDDESYRCAIFDEAARVAGAQWGGTHVLTFGDHDVRLSAWALDTEDRRYMQGVKQRAGVSMHPDGAYAAVVQRHDLRDYLGVYAVDAWRLVREIALDTADAGGASWSPDGLHVAVWDTAGLCVQVVNVAGMVKRTVSGDGPGVSACVWMASGQLLALAGFDGRVTLLDSVTWRAVATLSHRAHIAGDVDVFCEAELPAALGQTRRHTRFDLAATPHTLRSVSSSERVAAAAFSADGALLATTSAQFPCVLWVRRVCDMRLVAVVQTLRAVRAWAWSPVEPVLAFVTGAATVYLWREGKGCHLFEIPAASVAATRVVWNPDGGSLAVLAKGLFAMAYIT